MNVNSNTCAFPTMTSCGKDVRVRRRGMSSRVYHSEILHSVCVDVHFKPCRLLVSEVYQNKKSASWWKPVSICRHPVDAAALFTLSPLTHHVW